MKVLFLGTGEAFDPTLPNNSAVVISKEANIMVDCGYNIPQQYFNLIGDPEFIDGLYLTHLHADHCFGVPALLVWMLEEGRKKPLHLLGPKARLAEMMTLVDRGYPGASAKLTFQLLPVELDESKVVRHCGLDIRIAQTVHGAPNHAVRFDSGDGKSVMLSGDGEVTEASAKLFEQCSLVAHEAYRVTEHTRGHSSVREVLDTARKTSVGTVALVHTCRGEKGLLKTLDGPFIVPAPGSIVQV
jgi:ribonuclease Z